MIIDMGRRYWALDKTTSSFETLTKTLESFGLEKINQRPLGDEMGFHRVIDWKTKEGLSFSTIWFINLCHIRIGEWDSDLAEITFDAIEGSYVPYSEHDTIDFTYLGKAVFRLALKRGDEDG